MEETHQLSAPTGTHRYFWGLQGIFSQFKKYKASARPGLFPVPGDMR